MSMQLWRQMHQHLLGEVELEHVYSDEVRSPSRPLRELFGDRPQVRRNDAPKKVSRTIPAWFLNDDAVRKFLMLRFLDMPRGNFVHHTTGRRRRLGIPEDDCNCASCRDLRGATLWYHIITRLRRNEPAEEIAADWNAKDRWFKHKKLTAAGVRRILQQIRFIAAGKSADGKSRID